MAISPDLHTSFSNLAILGYKYVLTETRPLTIAITPAVPTDAAVEAAAEAIKKAVEQAEEKAGMTIDKINVGLPANLLQIEPTQGMIPVPSESKEIKDEDVTNKNDVQLKKGIEVLEQKISKSK